MKSRIGVSLQSNIHESDETENDKRDDYAHSDAGCIVGVALAGPRTLRSFEDVYQGVCVSGCHRCQSVMICSCIRGCW